jgi:hypothetical protein
LAVTSCGIARRSSAKAPNPKWLHIQIVSPKRRSYNLVERISPPLWTRLAHAQRRRHNPWLVDKLATPTKRILAPKLRELPYAATIGVPVPVRMHAQFWNRAVVE